MKYADYLACLSEARNELLDIEEDVAVSSHLTDQDARRDARQIDQRLESSRSQASKVHQAALDLKLDPQAVNQLVRQVQGEVAQEVSQRPVTAFKEARSSALSAAQGYAGALKAFYQEEERLERLAAEEAERQRLAAEEAARRAAEEAARLAHLKEIGLALRKDKLTLILGGVFFLIFAASTIGTPNLITLTLGVSFWGGIFAAVVAARKGLVFREMARNPASAGALMAFVTFYGMGMVVAGLSPRIGAMPGAWESFNSGVSRFGIIIGLGILTYCAVRLKNAWGTIQAVREANRREDSTLAATSAPPQQRVLLEKSEANDAATERQWKA